MEEAGGDVRAAAGTQEPSATASDGSPGGPLVVVGILVVVALVGLVAWMAGGDDVGADGRAGRRALPRRPDDDRAVDPGDGRRRRHARRTAPRPRRRRRHRRTDHHAAADAPHHRAADRQRPTSTASGARRRRALAGPSIAELVPSWRRSPSPWPHPRPSQAQIDQLLAGPRHDVASAGHGRRAVRGGRRSTARSRRPAGGSATGSVSSSTDRRRPRPPPGFGECVGNDGDPLDDGSYQYIATDADGDESAAGGFVVGAARVEQRFIEQRRRADLRRAHRARRRAATSRPTSSTSSRSRPAPMVTLPVADVDQDVETMSCRKGEVLATFDFRPDPGEVQQLRP